MHKNKLDVNKVGEIGAILHLPMAYHYLKIIKKHYNDIEKPRKLVIKLFLNIIFYNFVGTSIFFCPFVTYEIPFIRESKETWKFNYYSTGYRLLVLFLT